MWISSILRESETPYKTPVPIIKITDCTAAPVKLRVNLGKNDTTLY